MSISMPNVENRQSTFYNYGISPCFVYQQMISQYINMSIYIKASLHVYLYGRGNVFFLCCGVNSRCTRMTTNQRIRRKETKENQPTKQTNKQTNIMHSTNESNRSAGMNTHTRYTRWYTGGYTRHRHRCCCYTILHTHVLPVIVSFFLCFVSV